MSRLRAFAHDRRGNVVLIFALAIFVLGMVVATAIDLTRASSSKSHLQDTTDAAVLAAAKAYYQSGNLPAGPRLAAAQAAANAYMQSMVVNRATTLLNPTWEVTVSDKGVVTLTSHGASPAYLGSFFGIDKINFTTVAVAQGGAPRLEVVLVLDNTGSMKGKKLEELKKAAAALVESLESGAGNSTVAEPLKLGLVPFSMTVNVGSEYADAAWIDSKGQASIHGENFTPKKTNRFDLFKQMGAAWAGCVERRPAAGDYDILEKPPTAGDPDSLYVPYFAPDEPDADWAGDQGYQVFNDYLNDGNTGNNWDARQKNANKYNAKPASGMGGLGHEYHLGPNAGCELAPIARLTADTGPIKATIKDMVAIGNTDVAFGLQWGWHLISPKAPFADGKPYDTKDLKKVVILMTDGDNANSEAANPNNSIYSGIGYIQNGRLGITAGSSSARVKAMDDRLAKLCENMKKEKIELYTMRVEVKGSASTVLQNCASSPSNYFEVAKASDMNAAFQQIATSILDLHLSK